MLTESAEGPVVKIIDFGVARAALGGTDTTRAGGDATLTRFGDFIGKPRYASPEQAGALRPGERLDGRSDLYALGLVLYELATGASPFHSESPVGYLALQLSEKPPAPSKLRRDLEIPRALEKIILRCLEKRREDRFQDARSLGAALEEVGRSAAARPRGERPRRGALALAGGALAAALVAVSAGALWRASRSPSAPEPTRPVAAQPAPQPSRAAVPELAPSPAPVPAPTPERVEAKATPPADPAPASATSKPVTKPPAAKPPAPAPVAAPAAARFANDTEMQEAFDAALAFESDHDPAASIDNWKRFRARA